MTCNSCRPKLKTCPVCSVLLGSIRCLVIEKILEKLPRKCNFHKHGCAEKVVKEERLKHEMICKHLEVSCPETGCNDLIPRSSILEHLKQKHPSIIWNPNHTKFGLMGKDDYVVRPDKKSIKRRPCYIFAEGKHFYTTVIIDQEYKMYYFWMTLLGQVEEATGLFFRLNISNNRNVTIPVAHDIHAIGEPEDEVIEDGDSAAMSSFVLRAVATKENLIFLEFSVDREPVGSPDQTK